MTRAGVSKDESRQPWYEGIASFFRAPIGGVDDLRKGGIGVIGAPFDGSITLGRPGARYGPKAVREGSLYWSSVYATFENRTYVDLDSGIATTVPSLPLVDLGDADCFPMDAGATTESVASAVASVVERGAMPITIGGDHYIAYPAFKGVADALAKQDADVRIGYLHIDSHTDFWDEFPYIGKYAHGTSARRVSEHPNVAIERMAWLGLNGPFVGIDQYTLAKRHDLLMVTAEQLGATSGMDRVDEVLDRVSGADFSYVSIDIDVVDGSHSAGTGATVYGGISPPQFVSLLERVGRIPNLAGVDCCEVAPNLDPMGRTGRLAALGLISIIGERYFDRRPIAELLADVAEPTMDAQG